MKSTPLPIRVVIGVLSVLLLVSGAYGVWESVSMEAWFRIGFEVVLTLAGAIGLLTAMGRFESGPVWSMSCVSGAVFVCALLANSAGGEGQATAMTPGAMVRSALRNPHSAARLGVSLIILLMAGLTLLLRSPRVGFQRLFIGLGLLAPIAAGAALWFAGPLRSLVDGLHPVLQTALALLAFFAVVFLVSAGGHYLIRALEAGVEPTPDSSKSA